MGLLKKGKHHILLLSINILLISSSVLLISNSLQAKTIVEPLVTFNQRGTYCTFSYINKEESGLQAAFTDFFNSPECSQGCGSIHVTVNTVNKTIAWQWDKCGYAIRSYTVVSYIEVSQEANQGPPSCPPGQCCK